MSTGRTVTEEHLEALIEASTLSYIKMGDKTVVCHAILPSKFEVIVSAACVSPENFSMDIGKNLCLERLKSKLWELEGYRLQLRQS